MIDQHPPFKLSSIDRDQLTDVVKSNQPVSEYWDSRTLRFLSMLKRLPQGSWFSIEKATDGNAVAFLNIYTDADGDVRISEVIKP